MLVLLLVVERIVRVLFVDDGLNVYLKVEDEIVIWDCEVEIKIYDMEVEGLVDIE